jgi:hypothetical protein
VRLFAIVCAIGVIAAILILRPDNTAGPCVVEHRTSVADIPEASGLALSRRTPGILWSHNDSGNEAVLFALDTSGVLRGRVRVPIRTRDWEDISAARCPDGDCLYIADIGDNRRARTRIQIYRVPEPAPGDTETAQPEVFNATYPDGAHNAEALFVVGEDLFIVTRERDGILYRSALPADGTFDMRLERTGQLGLTSPVTDAETATDEGTVVVRTSKLVNIYRTADLVRGGSVSPVLSIPIEGLKEPQGEAIALDAHGVLFLASEGRPWFRSGRFIRLRCNEEAGPATERR